MVKKISTSLSLSLMRGHCINNMGSWKSKGPGSHVIHLLQFLYEAHKKCSERLSWPQCSQLVRRSVRLAARSPDW